MQNRSITDPKLTATQRQEIILAALAEQHAPTMIARDYYQGRQWSPNEVSTRSGRRSIDHQRADRHYANLTLNEIARAVDILTDLTRGVSNEKMLLSGSEIHDLEERTRQLTRDFLISGQAVTKVVETTNGTDVRILDPTNVVVQYSTEDREQIKEVIVTYPVSKEWAASEYGYHAPEDQEMVQFAEVWDTELGHVLLDGHVIETKLNPVTPLLPINVIRVDGPSYVSSLIPLQDEINIKLSEISEMIHYSSHPIITVKGARLNKNSFVGPDSILQVSDMDGEVKRIEGEGVPRGVAEHLQNLRKSFAEQARVTKIDPDRLTAISGQALRMMYMETMTKVEGLRHQIGRLLRETGRAKNRLEGKEEEVEIVFPAILPPNQEERIDNALKLKELGVEEGAIYQGLGLTK